MGVIIKFKDLSFDDSTELEVITIEDYIQIGLENDGKLLLINLDIDTAVKFSKELRRQIAIAKDFELNSEDNE